MAAQALYRKWRSQDFDEIVAQEHVTRTLRNALRDGRIAHAYLFAGPRGTGKTSMARLLAKAVNCVGDAEEKPCNRCPICQAITEGRSLDLIEIDAASNRGIDEVRELREKVGFRPNESRYRVYILDEAHMLTREAFNALLKTLEEPPPHAIFVLVTTEPHKIPETILSRCQRFDFRRVPVPDIVKHLRKIALEEGLNITDVALESIARQATGSMRDALSFLDQLMAYRQGEITLGHVQEVLGTAPLKAVGDLVDCLVAKDLPAGLRIINETADKGVEPRQFAREVVEYLRGVLLLKVSQDERLVNATMETLAHMQQCAQHMPVDKLLAAIRAFNQASLDLKEGVHPRLPLEMALVEAVLGKSGVVEKVEVVQAAPEVVTNYAPLPEAAGTESIKGQVTASDAKPTPAAEVGRAASDKEQIEPERPTQAMTVSWFQENWKQVLSAVRARNRSVEALLNKSCEPVEVRGNVLTLSFFHDFHKQKMEQTKNREVLEEALKEITGTSFAVKCVLCEADGQRRAQQKEEEERGERKSLALELDPVVREAVNKYGARIAQVHTSEE